MNSKHSQVLLVFGKNPRQWSYGWSFVLKTCMEQICCFDEVVLMALTSTEPLFIKKPLYRRFLHNDHWPYFH